MKDKILVFLFILYIFSFFSLGIIIPDQEISFSERRKLEQFPTTLKSDYINKLDKYFLDQFPFRDNFRSIKANFNYKILRMYDNNGIFLKNDYIFKKEYPTNKESISNFITKTNKLKDLLSPSNKAYFMMIPDKNYYLDDDNFLDLDYDYIYNELNKLNMPLIDIRNTLDLNDYYKTDTHFKQENLEKIILEVAKVVNFPYENVYYTKNTYDNFYGVYYGLSAINNKADKITYLTNDIIENAYVNYLENKDLHKVYNLDKLKGLDFYEVYLDGASSFIEIYNYNNKEGRELVIFRDSFGSSVAPLLINYYSKITLIDNRYISSNNFLNYIKFENQDVIFMYSTLVINNSGSLKG